MSSPDSTSDAPGAHRKALRRTMREARRNLGETEQIAGSEQVRDRLLHAAPTLLGHKAGVVHIAAYSAADGELDPMPAARALVAGVGNGRILWPRIPPDSRPGPLTFVEITEGGSRTMNRFDICEVDGPDVPADTLDLVLLPLVAFDRMGNRLGMGGGFYDRTFGPLAARRPMLIGVAHTLQEVGTLQTAAHDVALDAIATPVELIVPRLSRLAE